MRFWATCGCVGAVLAFCAPAAIASGPSARATRVGAAPAAAQLQLVLPLKADLAGLERFAGSVTTPGSPAYGHYRSIPELAARFGADAATRDRVVRYLRSAGATDVKLDATGLFADATVSAKWPRGCSPRRWPPTTPRARPGSSPRPRPPACRPALRGLVTSVVGLDTRRLSSRAAAVATSTRRPRPHRGRPAELGVPA